LCPAVQLPGKRLILLLHQMAVWRLPLPMRGLEQAQALVLRLVGIHLRRC